MPDCFEGVGEKGFAWLNEVKATTGMLLATEVMSGEQAALALRHGIDYLWLGARTVSNPQLVQQIADAIADAMSSSKQVCPCVMVKNPIAPDVRLWAGAVRRIAAVVGDDHVLAVHRGFKTEQAGEYRNAPCWSVVFEMKRMMPSLPVLLDPSHMSGRRDLVLPLAQKAVDLGFQGLMIEAHISPEKALSDASQQIRPEELRTWLATIARRTNHSSSAILPLRQQIDEIDDTLWALLLQRMKVSREIGEVKKREALPVLQESRFEEILSKRLDWAKKNDLSDDFVLQVMNAIHEESCKQQM